MKHLNKELFLVIVELKKEREKLTRGLEAESVGLDTIVFVPCCVGS